jgi:hypothetical protein
VFKRLIEIWDPVTGKIWQSYLYPNVNDKNSQWRERVYADFQSARETPAPSAVTSTASALNGGILSIHESQRKYFE